MRPTEVSPLDAISLLKKDHKRVKELFKEAEGLGDRANAARKRLFEEIDRELKVHTEIENDIFYAQFKQRAQKHKEEKKEVLEAYEEHHVVDGVIADLEATDPKDETYPAKLQVLRELVEHHIKEEEGTMFKMARKLFDKDELERIGAEMEAAKEEAEA